MYIELAVLFSTQLDLPSLNNSIEEYQRPSLEPYIRDVGFRRNGLGFFALPDSLAWKGNWRDTG